MTTQLEQIIRRTVRDSIDDPTIFVIAHGTVRGEPRYFARDVVTHRAVKTPDETVVGTVWRGAFTLEPSIVS